MTETKLDASLRFSPLKFTKSLLQRSSYLPSNKNINRLQSNRYFCHYSNAVYMGGMDSFKKNGYGVMLLDNGTCAITCYSHDTPVQTHIIFREKSLSIVTLTGKTKIVTYRTGPYLITASYNNRNFIEGIGYLVDFKQNKLYKLAYYQSRIDKKQEMKDQRILNNIFVNLQYSDILEDPTHIEFLFMNFNITKSIGSFKQKHQYNNQNIYTIGFINRNEKKQETPYCNGLAFKIRHNSKPDEFAIKLIQRGYFQGEKMERFGQRHYQNGNYYIGDFKNDLFEGYGVLVHPQQNKWTYGIYKKGQLIDIIESSINSRFKLNQIIKKVHEDEETYIQNYAKIIPNQAQLKLLISNSLSEDIPIQIIQDPKQQALRTLNNLKSIRDDYIKRQYESKTQQIIMEQLSKQKNKIYKNFVEGLPIRQKSPSKSNSKQKQKYNEDQTRKQQQKFLNYQLKSSKASKSRTKSQQRQKQKQKQIKNKKQPAKNSKIPKQIIKNYNSSAVLEQKERNPKPNIKPAPKTNQPTYQIKVTSPNKNNLESKNLNKSGHILIKEQSIEFEKSNDKNKDIFYDQKLKQIQNQIQRQKQKRDKYLSFNFSPQNNKKVQQQSNKDASSPINTLKNSSTNHNSRQFPHLSATQILNRSSNNPQQKPDLSLTRPYYRYNFADNEDIQGILKPSYQSLHDPYSHHVSTTTVSARPFQNYQQEYQLQKNLYKKLYQVGYMRAFTRIYPEQLQKSRSKSIEQLSGQKLKRTKGYRYLYDTQQNEQGDNRGYLQNQLIRRRNQLRDRLMVKYGFDRK